MRFLVGLSFRPRLSKIKWLIFGFLGLGALFFSNILSVNAYSNSANWYPSFAWGYDSSNYKVDETITTTSDTFYFDTAGTDYNKGYWSSYYSSYFQNNNCRFINMTTWFKAYNSNMQLLNRNLSISARYYGTTNGISGRVIDSSNGYIANEWYNIDTTQRFDFGVYTGGSTGYIEGPLNITYECITSDTDQIIANDNSNTQQIINNNSQNTQDIINNQNSNNQALIDSNKVCDFIDKNSIFTDNSLLQSNGSIGSNGNYGITDFIKIDNTTQITPIDVITAQFYYCTYDINKVKLNCYNVSTLQPNVNIFIDNNASYIRFTIYKQTNKPTFNICKNGNQAIADSQQQINDNLTNDNVSGATNTASDGFTNTDVSDVHGLTSIITAPIRLLQKLLDGGTCDAYSFDITMNNQTKNVSLPSGCILWNNVPGSVVAIYHVSIFGLLGYRILIDLVHFVNSLRDPDKKNDYTLDL